MIRNEALFDLNRFLLYGGLPNIVFSEDVEEDLSDYVDTYLTEEIKAEAKLRNLKGFEKFLKQIALRNGEMINYSSVVKD